MEFNPEWLGIPAAILTTAAYVPQAIKVIRTKHTQSISLMMYCCMTAGIFCWFLYGVALESPSLILANGITCLLAALILVMKIKHG